MSKPTVNYWKWIVVIAIAVALFMIGRCNGIKSVIKTEGRDTVITVTKTDTVYQPSEPEFIGVTNTIHVPVFIHDTLETFEVRIDTVKAVTAYPDYMAVRYYSDTQRLARGTVIIQDSVTQNKIKQRRLQTFGTDTTITNTVTLRQPKRIIGYFTTSLTGNLHDPVDGIGGGFALKGKNDVIFGAEVKFQTDKRPMYEGRIMLPIRLTKRN